MARHLHHADVAVVGGGVIGLSIAWRAAQAGLDVVLLERGTLGHGASWAAAGMLAPVSEADVQEPELLALGRESAARWPAFAAELEAASGLDVGYRACGTLLLARDRDEAEHVEREREVRERLGLRVERLLGSAARRAEPALAPALRLALSLPDDHAVEPRKVLAALAEACRRAGVDVREHAPVTSLRDAPGEHIVLAAGAWSPALAPVPVRPVKGEALLLRDPAGPGLCEHVLRYDGGYLVPRGDGRYYLGATMEERGFEATVRAGGVYELLRDASELLPGVLELAIEELVVGHRPGTPDNQPVLGPDPDDPRVIRATGHFRHGILLSPVTAERVLGLLRAEIPA